MTIRRRFLQIAASALIFANSCSWAAPGDWQDTLGTPFDIRPNEVDVRSAQFNGRACVAVEMSAEVQKRALGAGGNGPTVAILDTDFNNGVIEVDIAGAINGKGSPDSRAFAGLAFHIAGSTQTFEAVYLRMSNGSKNVPPPPAPRDVRAVQYVAHPDFHFDVSRKQFPEKYEKAAPVALDTWHRLRIEIAGSRMRVSVDGVEILDVDDLRLANRGGSVGLFVDDGTTGYFSNLRILQK